MDLKSVKETKNNSKKTGSEIISLGKDFSNIEWNAYYNYDLGIAFKFPKKVGFYKKCDAKRDVALKVFEDGNTIYLASEKAEKFKGSKKDGRVTNDLDIIKKKREEQKLDIDDGTAYYFTGIKMDVIEDIKNEKAVNNYLKERYVVSNLPYCSIENLVKNYNEDTYYVKLNRASCDASSEEWKGCCINYKTFNKFSPTYKKIINFNMGQDDVFLFRDPEKYTNRESADRQFIDSVRFIEN